MSERWQRAAVVALLFSLWALARWGGDITPEGSRWDVRRVPVTLYFGAPDAMGVAPEIRWFPVGESDAGARLEALLAGPLHPELSPSIPRSATIRSLRLEGNLAIVDFGGGIVRDHPGGSAGELITVYSVVNTLTELPEIERVQWLIDGHIVETLVGHLDLTGPIERSEEIIVDLRTIEL